MRRRAHACVPQVSAYICADVPMRADPCVRTHLRYSNACVCMYVCVCVCTDVPVRACMRACVAPQRLQSLNIPWINTWLTTNNISAGSGTVGGAYYQLTSQVPGQGPCYPILVPTASIFNRCDLTPRAAEHRIVGSCSVALLRMLGVSLLRTTHCALSSTGRCKE